LGCFWEQERRKLYQHKLEEWAFKLDTFKYAEQWNICQHHTLKTSVSSTYEMLIRYSRPNSKAEIFSCVGSRIRMWACINRTKSL
jgi:hypothetical protein